MNRPQRQLNPAGFTIVETIIVLAIAGIFLIMVFLALPALERNSRNSQRRQDVQTVLQAVSHVELSNSGNMPDNTTSSQFSNALKSRLTYYDGTSIAYPPSGSASAGIKIYDEQPTTTAASETENSLDVVDVYNYRKCSTTTQGASTNAGAGYNDVVALFAIETASNVAPQCQQL